MAVLNGQHKPRLDSQALDVALRSLAIRLDQNGSAPVEMVVCGGSALILSGLIRRTTRDVDLVALIRESALCAPAPMPADLQQAASEVAEDLGLPEDWLNNGPSRDEGGLFQMGLPAGFQHRLTPMVYGNHLTVHVISRIDQIHFKLYAAADQGGYHVSDLRALDPTPDELLAAARWAMTHDVSETFAGILKELLRHLGYDTVADRL